MKKLSMVVVLLCMMVLGSIVPVGTAAAAPTSCDTGQMGFVPWYAGLTTGPPDCNIKTICHKDKPGCVENSTTVFLDTFIWTVVANISSILLTSVVYIAIGFIMFGGFKYMTSQGSPDRVAGAKKTITAAIIGMIIALLASAIVSYIMGRLF